MTKFESSNNVDVVILAPILKLVIYFGSIYHAKWNEVHWWFGECSLKFQDMEWIQSLVDVSGFFSFVMPRDVQEYNAEFHMCKFRRIGTLVFYSRRFICDVGWIHSYLSSVLPIGATFALTLWLGNTSYLYISVSFAQMLKSISKFVSLYHVFCLRYGGFSWSL
jgi:hypothetical protein